jgi:predicted nucleic acid-binding protein
VVELVHGVYRSDTVERRARREAFLEELFASVAVYPLSSDVARLAGRLDAEQQSRGVVIPPQSARRRLPVSLGQSGRTSLPTLPSKVCQ